MEKTSTLAKLDKAFGEALVTVFQHMQNGDALILLSRTSETAFVIHCLELNKKTNFLVYNPQQSQKHANQFPASAAQDFVREKHKPIKCQEQLTSAFSQIQKENFSSAPIIKVNKNEYRIPQRSWSCRFLWPTYKLFSTLWEAYGFIEMPGMNESVLVFTATYAVHSLLCSPTKDGMEENSAGLGRQRQADPPTLAI